MTFFNKEETRAKINEFARKRVPFIFFTDCTGDNGMVCEEGEAADQGVLFNFKGVTNDTGQPVTKPLDRFELSPVTFEEYERAFAKVMHHLKRGDTYLLNLTFPTPIFSSFTLEETFRQANAAYKLLVKERFVVFSPEIFVRIADGKISSFPMKGTIDAELPGAEEMILSDQKELCEHNTIVDLIRNDLAMVSEKVEVTRFRYIDHIHTNRKNLLQVSSEITGELKGDYISRLGDILFTLLPAGSVTGAPKEKTMEIIRATEPDARGFYTGICGRFDGSSLDSAVMIRFIEQTPNGLAFRSGGGITAMSNAADEYKELSDKVYVPVV